MLVALVAAKVGAHWALIERYGFHRDELYFIDCGRHLDWGYVDHPPFVPWVARLMCDLSGCDLAWLRMPAVLAGGITLALVVLLARDLGGRGFAQVIAGLCFLMGPQYLRMGKILCIPVFEVMWWTIAAWLLVRMIRSNAPKLWLWCGLVAGIGLLTKHSMLLWGAGVLVGTLLTPSLRKHLKTPWPWLGGVIAFAVFLPNVIWQVQNEWATAQFLRNVSEGTLAAIPRPLFVAGQLLYAHPFTAPIWIAGLWSLFRGSARPFRVLGWVYVVAFAVLLIGHGKPYYLAGAYPALFATGAVQLERWISARSRVARAAVIGALVIGSALAIAVGLPVFRLEAIDKGVGALLGRVVPPIALTHDLHDEFGWREQAETLASVAANLPAEDRSEALVLAHNYGQAAAVSFFGPELHAPPVASGHMSYYLWPPARDPRVVIAVGYTKAELKPLFDSVEQAATVDHPLAVPWQRSLPVYVCRGARASLPETWPSLKRFRHRLARNDLPQVLELEPKRHR